MIEKYCVFPLIFIVSAMFFIPSKPHEKRSVPKLPLTVRFGYKTKDSGNPPDSSLTRTSLPGITGTSVLCDMSFRPL